MRWQGLLAAFVVVLSLPGATATTSTLTVTASGTSHADGKFFIDGVEKKSLSLTAGNTYIFNLDDATNNHHPLSISTTSDGTHTGGVEYDAMGVNAAGLSYSVVLKSPSPGYNAAFASTQARSLTFAPASAGTYYYYCAFHSGIGGTITVSGVIPPAPPGPPSDKLPPRIISFSPAQGGPNQNRNVNVILTFNENVQKGTGNVVLTPSRGNAADVPVTIDVTSGQVAVVGAVVTINPTNNLVDAGGKTYTVTMGTGVLQDAYNNGFPGLSGLAYQFGVADSTSPVVATYLPAQGATGQLAATNIVLTFSEFIQAGSGNVVLTPSGGTGTDTAVNIEAASGLIMYAGTVVTINPLADLIDSGGKTYTVTMASGVMKDAVGNNYGGISGTTYQFTIPDATAPTVAVYNPGLLSVGNAKTADIVLTFSETVTAGTGNIVITPTTGSATTVAAGDAQVTVSGSLVTINPTADLIDTGIWYTVTAAAGTFTDGTNQFAGIAGTAYEFYVADTTIATISTKSPLHNAANQDSNTDIEITFSEPVQAGTGTIDFTPSGGNGDTSPRQIPVTDYDQVRFSGNKMRINPWTSLNDNGGRTQTMTFGSGVVTDMAHNSATPLTSGTYAFSVLDITPPEIVGRYNKDTGVPEGVWSVVPARGATNIAKTSDIVLTFNERVQGATGNIVLTPSGGSGVNSPMHIDITDSGIGGQIAIGGDDLNVLTINPDFDLLDMGTKTYHVTVENTVIRDVSSLYFQGFEAQDYYFTVADSSPPLISEYYPLQGAVGVRKDVGIVLTFNENVQKGTSYMQDAAASRAAQPCVDECICVMAH